MDVVPNCGKGPLSSGCFASGIPQGRHLQMPGRSWRAGLFGEEMEKAKSVPGLGLGQGILS